MVFLIPQPGQSSHAAAAANSSPYFVAKSEWICSSSGKSANSKKANIKFEIASLKCIGDKLAKIKSTGQN
jgi:hypothetical protein